ncbi:site-specific integrase [Neorhizobium sp. AL 9.2.2]|uniref:site-specific integrase n=1 Tax=Neorhizobium sp. AL 9.2.2 TaxID=2712894 RepID=UPI001573BDA0|nr:site-specific integrase [Neorhizobium sp. AL 9.2.2]NSY20205.1 site-specific integrase [Neorhizobium sp. AL 9.2.2]
MAKHVNKGLAFDSWPADDRAMFENLTVEGAVDDGPWLQLSATTIRNRRYSYGHWLGFLRKAHARLLKEPPGARVTAEAVKDYVLALRQNNTETAISIQLQRLYFTISAAVPQNDWGWLFRLTRRVRKRAVPLSKPYVPSVDLYRLGLELMEDARNKSALFTRIIRSQAEQFRDGLMIAFLAIAPMRRAGFTKLCLEEHVIKIGGMWRVFLSADMVKTGLPEDFEIPTDLGRFVDEYVQTYRPAFPNSDAHAGMWPYGDRPMTDKMVRRYLCKHTKDRLGTAISPHGFRRGAASFLAAADPKSVRAAKDLLQHHSFAVTEKHYIYGANSRRAGQSLAEIIAQKAAEIE